MFRASHVEVKLAVHAIYVLLKMWNIPTEKVTLRELSELGRKTWSDGSRPRFEIYFSKKNCSACAKYVRKLEALTGVQIKLLWKERLVKIDYVKKVMGQLQQPDVIAVEESEEEEVSEIEMVDLTDEVEVVVEDTPEPLGVYINGLAYCVGQMDSEPERVRDAIFALARISRRQKMVQRTGGLRNQSWRERPRTFVPPVQRGNDAGIEMTQSRDGERTCPKTPVPEQSHSAWLATPPPSSRRNTQQEGHDTLSIENRAEAEIGRGSPLQYSFPGGEGIGWLD